jgi:hypothetical protein
MSDPQTPAARIAEIRVDLDQFKTMQYGDRGTRLRWERIIENTTFLLDLIEQQAQRIAQLEAEQATPHLDAASNTVARMAGHVAGQAMKGHDWKDGDDAYLRLAIHCVKVARAIVAEVQRTEPTPEAPA